MTCTHVPFHFGNWNGFLMPADCISAYRQATMLLVRLSLRILALIICAPLLTLIVRLLNKSASMRWKIYGDVDFRGRDSCVGAGLLIKYC